MEIFITDKASHEFYEVVNNALDTFPEYIQETDSKIILGRTLHDIDSSLSKYWRDVAMMYRPSNGQIFLAEYYGSDENTKNHTILGGIAHESGYFFDHRVFGNSQKQGCFSTDPEQSFLAAWKADRKNL